MGFPGRFGQPRPRRRSGSHRNVERFRAAAREHVAANFGECQDVDGALQVRTEDGTALRIGLGNLVATCGSLPPEDWGAAIDAHLRPVFAALDGGSPDFADVESQIKVRVYGPAMAEEMARLGAGRAEALVTRSVGGDLFAALMIDLPNASRNVAPALLTAWDRTPDELFELGLRNVRDQDRPPIERYEFDDGGVLSYLQSESLFTAAWLLMLEEFAGATPPAGTIVAIPDRHHLLFVPIARGIVPTTIPAMLEVTAELFMTSPGVISPHLYWRRGTELTQLTHIVGRGRKQRIRLEPPFELLEAIAGVVDG